MLEFSEHNIPWPNWNHWPDAENSPKCAVTNGEGAGSARLGTWLFQDPWVILTRVKNFKGTKTLCLGEAQKCVLLVFKSPQPAKRTACHSFPLFTFSFTFISTCRHRRVHMASAGSCCSGLHSYIIGVHRMSSASAAWEKVASKLHDRIYFWEVWSCCLVWHRQHPEVQPKGLKSILRASCTEGIDWSQELTHRMCFFIISEIWAPYVWDFLRQSPIQTLRFISKPSLSGT